MALPCPFTSLVAHKPEPSTLLVFAFPALSTEPAPWVVLHTWIRSAHTMLYIITIGKGTK